MAQPYKDPADKLSAALLQNGFEVEVTSRGRTIRGKIFGKVADTPNGETGEEKPKQLAAFTYDPGVVRKPLMRGLSSDVLGDKYSYRFSPGEIDAGLKEELVSIFSANGFSEGRATTKKE